MLVVWNVVVIGSAAVNVAEVVFAKEDLDAGNVGFGVLVAASGVGLALGSFLAAPALGKVGLRRHYVGSIVLMGVGWGAAALSGSIWVAVPFVIGGAAGNGAAIVCNRLLVQRGAPDQYRGRALATIMSSNYAVFGLAMAAAGVLTDQFGARAVWIGGGRCLPRRCRRRARHDPLAPGAQRGGAEAIEESAESAVAALANGNGPSRVRRAPSTLPTPASSGSRGSWRRSRRVVRSRRATRPEPCISSAASRWQVALVDLDAA